MVLTFNLHHKPGRNVVIVMARARLEFWVAVVVNTLSKTVRNFARNEKTVITITRGMLLPHSLI